MLRNLDAERLAEMLSTTERIQWRLNVHTLDDETIPLLERFEEDVKDLHAYLNSGFGEPSSDGSLKHELAGLKKTRAVAFLLEKLAKHHIAILGAEYLFWESHFSEDETDPLPSISVCYSSLGCLFLSVETQPAQPRRVEVRQGTVPPKLGPDRTIKVGGIARKVVQVIQEERIKNKQASMTFVLDHNALKDFEREVREQRW